MSFWSEASYYPIFECYGSVFGFLIVLMIFVVQMFPYLAARAGRPPSPDDFEVSFWLFEDMHSMLVASSMLAACSSLWS